MPSPTTERQLGYVRPWLYPEQAVALFTPARWSLIEASTKSGKTVGCIAWLFEQAALHGRDGRNYWWVAPTLPVAKIAFRRMKRAIPRPLYTANDTDCTIRLRNGAVLWFKGADRPDVLYGEDVYGAVIDEASRCKRDAWTAIRTTLTATRGPARIIGNVKGKHNWAYQLARRAEAGTLRDAAYFRLTADDAIRAGIFPSDEVASAKEHMPEAAWKELYYAEAADDGSNPFGWDAIHACTVTDEGQQALLRAEEPLCFGWDFGRGQDWTVGIALTGLYEVCRFYRKQAPTPWGDIKADIHELNRATPAWGDSTAMGGDVILDDLQRMGVPMIGVPFSKPMKQTLMERLRAALHQKKLRVPEGPITQELESFEYHYSLDGSRVYYRAPEGMHDDCVMALALAVFGRDQFGELPERLNPVAFDPDQHPGFEDVGGTVKRRKPWEAGWRPDVPEKPSWIPSKTLEPL